jgi:Bacteriophage replication gene A protein (GPA)
VRGAAASTSKTAATKTANQLSDVDIVEYENDRTRQSIVERLEFLAPLHQKAALRRAARAAELPQEYTHPTLDILKIAECPPAKILKVVPCLAPAPASSEQIEAEAARLLTLPHVRFHGSEDERKLRAKEHVAQLLSIRQTTAQNATRIVCVNASEYEHGQRLARQHGPLLAALDDLLHGIDDIVGQSHLAALPDAELKQIADGKATSARLRYARRAQDVLRRWGEVVPAPRPEERRQMDPIWHRRRLRRQAGQTRQHLAAALGTVGRGGAAYADDYSVERKREVDESGRTWAAERVLRSPNGENTVPMSEIVKAGKNVSMIRLRTMTRGLDDYAVHHNLPAIFVTMTLPPAWHPNPAMGRATWNGASPKQTDGEMQRTWQRFRARLAANKVRCLGFRVWEPHRDGCPHAHALLYVNNAEQIETVDKILLDLCPEPESRLLDEHGNQRRVASKLEIIDRTRGSGASYLSKYLTDALDDEETAEVGEAGSKRANAERVRATASERGWRRYGFLGVHGVQKIWQRIVSMNKTECEDAPAAVLSIKNHIEGSEYREALERLGAIKRVDESGQKTLPTIQLDYEKRLTQYGDTARRAVSMSTVAEPWTVRLSRGWTCERANRRQAIVFTKSDKEAIKGWFLRCISSQRASVEHNLTVNVSYPSAAPPARQEEALETIEQEEATGSPTRPPQVRPRWAWRNLPQPRQTKKIANDDHPPDLPEVA